MIQKLENELGIKIFDRRRQPIVTTKAGQAVIRQAKEVLCQSRRLREIVEEEKDTYLGTFTIGVLPTIAPYLIPHFFPQLMREHPEMDLRIVEMKTKDMKQALLNGDIDTGILAKIEGLEMFNSTHLYTEKYFAYISENDPLFVKERIKTTDLNVTKFVILRERSDMKQALLNGDIDTGILAKMKVTTAHILYRSTIENDPLLPHTIAPPISFPISQTHGGISHLGPARLSTENIYETGDIDVCQRTHQDHRRSVVQRREWGEFLWLLDEGHCFSS